VWSPSSLAREQTVTGRQPAADAGVPNHGSWTGTGEAGTAKAAPGFNAVAARRAWPLYPCKLAPWPTLPATAKLLLLQSLLFREAPVHARSKCSEHPGQPLQAAAACLRSQK
jgi:hypothetical protein